jgi:hypothetical protein
MILIVMLHPTNPPRRLRFVYFVLALFFVTGTKPEVLYMFLLYVAILIFVLAALRRSTPSALGASLVSSSALGASLVSYVVVPFAFYAWQIPLVRSLLATSTIRFRGSPESALGIIENIYLSILTSNALRVGLVTLAGVVIARSVLVAGLASIRHHHPARPPALYPTLTSAGLLLGLLIFVLGLRYLVPYATPLGGVVVTFVLWGVITARMSNLDVPIPAALCLPSLWRWPLLTAGTYSAIFETYGVTAARSVPAACAFGFLFFMIVGGVFRPSRPHANPTTRDGRLSTLSDSLILGLALGWVFRDFLALPLFDVLNFLWVNPRDVFWYAPCPVFLAVIGLARFADSVRLRGFVTTSGIDRLSLTLQYAFVLLLIATVSMGLYEATFRFHVWPGHPMDNAIWEHFTRAQARTRKHRIQTYRQQYQALRDQEGGFARGITHSNNDLGLAGAGARYGVPDAWAWDFVSDSYRRLAARAYGVDEGDRPHPWPRLWNSSIAAIRVYSLRYPSWSLVELSNAYWRQVVMETSPHADPFYLELLRVGIIWNYVQPRLDAHPQISMLSETSLLTYRIRPAQSLQRWGVLPDGPTSRAEREQFLGSDRTDELRAAYRDMMFSPGALADHGFEVRDVSFRANYHRFIISTTLPGHLVVFDSWHPDWHVAINGRSQPLIRAFLNLRAVRLEPGINHVEFAYRPGYLWLGVSVTAAAILVTGLYALGSTPRGRSLVYPLTNSLAAAYREAARVLHARARRVKERM